MHSAIAKTVSAVIIRKTPWQPYKGRTVAAPETDDTHVEIIRELIQAVTDANPNHRYRAEFKGTATADSWKREMLEKIEKRCNRTYLDASVSLMFHKLTDHCYKHDRASRLQD